MRKEIKLGFFLIIVFVVFGYFIIKTESCSEFFSKGKRYPLIAKFTTSAGMFTSAPVRLAGVKIGIVEKIYLEHRKAVVRMMIEKKYKLLEDARVVISTIGFIGEKYVEIVYKDEFKTENPQYIPPGGEILVIEPFNLESITAKFDKIYESTLKITDSINGILSDKYSKESLQASFHNLNTITERLASLLAESGKVSRGLDHLDHLVLEMDKVFADDKKGLLGDLKSTSEKIDRVAADLTKVSDDLRQGKGTANESQEQHCKVVRECRILIDTPMGVAPLDLRVTATPLPIDSDEFVVIAIEDISQSNRLAVLQRIFFHDVLNTAGCIQGYTQYLLDEMTENQEICRRLVHLAGCQIETIQSQRDLILAESGDLKTQPIPMDARQVLEELRSHYQKHSLADNRAIKVRYACDGTIVADRQLLHRVLGNMIKNALEATPSGHTVSIDCHEQNKEVVFAVHNADFMPEEIQRQIFQRSFSTKAASGRGIGTHSIKLLGEQYLKGKVSFSSQPDTGTTFWLAIPKTPTDWAN